MAERAMTWMILAAVIGACCGGGSPSPTPSPDVRIGDCPYGTRRDCSCADGREGFQTCGDLGWDACICLGPAPCSASNPTGTCPSGQTCAGGVCCAAGQACGTQCCNETSVCVRDRSGNAACAARCDTNTECPGVLGMRCCRVLRDPSTGAPLSYGACGTPITGDTCRCVRGSDCGTGACTPSLSDAGVPVQPYICTQPACAPYSQCPSVGNCGVGYCNLCDGRGNCFCASTCVSDADCGGARCRSFRSNGACPDSQQACAPR